MPSCVITAMVTKTRLCWVQSHHGWEWLEIYIWSTGPNPWYEMVLYLRRRLFHDQLLLSNWMMFGLLLSKTLDGCGNFPFQYWKWGRPCPDINIIEITNWNQSVYKFEIIFRFRNSEICRSPCVTQPWQATWKRFYNFSETFITSKLFNLLLHILITFILITII